ncbi:endochitinase [Mycena rebaudengoi]|nr:endochitinase [Mycena rebaudengoi]
MYCHILIALLTLPAHVLASIFYQATGRPHYDLARRGVHLHTDTAVNVSGTDRVASGWYAGWLHDIPKIPWSQYNAVTFAFAFVIPYILTMDESLYMNSLTTDDPTNITVSPDPSTLSQFVAAAQVHKVKAILSIGGLVNTSTSRTKFVNAVLGLVTTYTLDGIDFDWEYPGADPDKGLRCNERHPDDSANFLLFLQELRARKEGKELILTAAVGLTPFSGMSSVAEFAKVLNYIGIKKRYAPMSEAIMAYDVWGAGWSNTVGPNAPLYDSGMPLRMGSTASVVTAWTSLGFPANQASPQITLGIAAYGRSYFVDPTVAFQSDGQLALYQNFDHLKVPQGNADDPKVPWVDPCGDSSGNSGEFTFDSLISGGYLDANGHVHDGIYYKFDRCVGCSETPFVYNKSSSIMISFDDAESFAAKGDFISKLGLRGFSVWHVNGDSSDNILLGSIRNSTGWSRIVKDDLNVIFDEAAGSYLSSIFVQSAIYGSRVSIIHQRRVMNLLVGHMIHDYLARAVVHNKPKIERQSAYIHLTSIDHPVERAPQVYPCLRSTWGPAGAD